jgi:hypothetical protein
LIESAMAAQLGARRVLFTTKGYGRTGHGGPRALPASVVARLRLEVPFFAKLAGTRQGDKGVSRLAFALSIHLHEPILAFALGRTRLRVRVVRTEITGYGLRRLAVLSGFTFHTLGSSDAAVLASRTFVAISPRLI